jgi:hypothetical protein
VGNPRTALLLSIAGAKTLPKQGELKFSDQEKFWWNPDRQKAAASAELVLQRNPFLLAAMRIYGHRMVVWGEEEFAEDLAPPLNAAWLQQVGDGAFQDFRLGKWKDVPFWELPDEYKVYNEALVKAHTTPLDAFQKSAEANKGVTFAQMYAEPWKFRGAVIPIEGRLRRIREYDAPRLAREDEVKKIYEGWIFLDTPGTHPVCVIFTRLPEGLQLGEQVNARVTFYGYFFKKYRYVTGEQYTAKDGTVHNRQRDTLLLVGPTLVVDEAAVVTGVNFVTPETTQLLAIVLAVAAGAGVIVLVMNMMYRRADEKVRKEVDQIRAVKEVQFEDEAPGTTIPTETGEGPLGDAFAEGETPR